MVLDTIVDRAAFWLGAFVLFWAHIIGSLLRRIKFMEFAGPRNDMYEWSKLMMDFLGVSVYHVHGELYRGGDALFMANHRSWGDFFIDTYLTEGRASLMSRMLVFYVFPVFMTSALIIRSLILINRGNVGDKNRFNERLDKLRNRTHAKGIVIYPEGTRNLGPGYKPLRKGMLVYAYSRKLPVQIIITANKESVMGSEKRMDAHFGQHIWVGYAPVLRPEDFPTLDAFWERFQQLWDEEWRKVYGADPSALKPLVQQPPLFDYPLSMRLLQLLSVLSGVVLLGLTLGLNIRGAANLSARLGPTGTALVAGPLLLLAGLLAQQSLLGGGRRRAKKLAERQKKAAGGALPLQNKKGAPVNGGAKVVGDGAAGRGQPPLQDGATPTRRRNIKE